MNRPSSTVYDTRKPARAIATGRDDSHRLHQALTVLAEVQPAVYAAVNTLALCVQSPQWPDLPSRTKAHARALRAGAASIHRHARDASPCTCRPDHSNHAARLTEAWLALYRVTITSPGTCTEASITSAATLVQDYARWIITGHPGDVLGTDRTSETRTELPRRAVPHPPLPHSPWFRVKP